MRYRVTRTSDFLNEEKPCSKAKKFKLPTEEHSLWYIDINTLDDLRNLIDEVGHSLVIDNYSIEIYDDFRE